MTTIDSHLEIERAIGLHRLGKAGEADAALRALMVKYQDDARTLNRLGTLAGNAGLTDHATASLQRAAALAPRDPIVLRNLAAAVAAQSRYDVAIDALERAIAIDPSASGAWEHLEFLLNSAGAPDRALVVAQRQQRGADHFATRMNIIRALAQLGKFEEAEKEALAVVKRWPNRAGGYVALAPLRKFEAGDRMIADAQRLADSNSCTGLERRDLHFALGKMYDDAEFVDDAFRMFALANQDDPARYDQIEFASRSQTIRTAYTSEFLEERRSHGFPSEKPVFVIGMPRSGTTLIESILAAHADVGSIGEGQFLRILGQEIGDFTPREEENLASALRALSPEGAEFLGRRYVRRAETAAGDCTKLRIVDAMPENFTNLGLAALTLPNAKIIHVRRSPMATALSCWMQNFNRYHEYAGRFEDLAHYYSQYKLLMEHWHHSMGDRILTVDYEDVVSAPDQSANLMLNWLGLTSDRLRLGERHRLRVVTTASVWQVRQPVTQHSVNKWRAYERHLSPLKEAFRAHGIEPV